MVKPVFVELDGKTKELKYTFGAMMMYEKLAETTLEQSLNNMGFKTMLALYTAGLQHADKGVTPQRVMKMLEKEMDNGKTDDDLFMPPIESLYRSGRLKKFYYKMFREAFGDDWNVDGSVPLEELEDDEGNKSDISFDEDDEVKNA